MYTSVKIINMHKLRFDSPQASRRFRSRVGLSSSEGRCPAFPLAAQLVPVAGRGPYPQSIHQGHSGEGGVCVEIKGQVND